jgi:hypothetical protein
LTARRIQLVCGSKVTITKLAIKVTSLGRNVRPEPPGPTGLMRTDPFLPLSSPE